MNPATPPTASNNVSIRILAGPFQAFGPLRIRESAFVVDDGGSEIVPLPVDWLPRHVGRQSHSDLALAEQDARLDVASRIIQEDISSTKMPLLVLPDLSRQVLTGTPPGPGRLAVTDVLLRLQERLGNADLYVRLLAIEGIDDTPQLAASLEADRVRLRDALQKVGLTQVVVTLLPIGPLHPAYWRAALNRLTSMGDAAPAQAEQLLCNFSDEQLALAAFDHDGRQVLDMAPPQGFIPPTERPSADDEDGEGDVTAVVVPAVAPGGSRREERLPATPTRRIDLNGRRVTFVCEKLADRSGGAERVLIELANALCRRGYQVEILSHEFRGKPAFYPLELGVVHTNLSPRRGVASARDRAMQKAKTAMQKRELAYPLDRLAFSVRYAAFQRRLGEHIDATRPDVVVPFMPPAIVATALAASNHRPMRVASMHNAPEQDFENPERWDPGAYARRRRFELMDRMDVIAVLLPRYQDWYPLGLRDRTAVIPNAVVPVAPERLARTRRRKTVLAVGRLADTKRNDLTLRAFARLAPEFPDWNLKIFGVGPMADELEALRDELGLQGRAELRGHTASIAQEYLEAGVLCHPARFEGFPLAVTESLASGLPVVGFADCSGVNSLVVDDENGVLIDPLDGSDEARLDTLVAALRRLMADEAVRSRLGEGGPVSMEEYAPERVVDVWEQVLFPA